jgi:hypothetical protein
MEPVITHIWRYTSVMGLRDFSVLTDDVQMWLFDSDRQVVDM